MSKQPESSTFSFSPALLLHVHRQRAVVEEPYELRRHPASLRLTLLAAFSVLRMQEITDTLVDLLLEIVHRLELKAERKADKELLEDLKRVTGKNNLLFQLARAALEHPEGIVKDVIYPIVPEQTLRDLVKEWRASGPAYRQKVTLTNAPYIGISLEQRYASSCNRRIGPASATRGQ